MLYHVWFDTRGRKWLLIGEVEERVKSLLWQTAKDKGINLLECETAVNHVHLLLRTEAHNLPAAVRFLKGVSARRIFKDFPDLKVDTMANSFWQVRYGAKPIAEEARTSVISYIRSQKERLEKFDRPRKHIPQA